MKTRLIYRVLFLALLLSSCVSQQNDEETIPSADELLADKTVRIEDLHIESRGENTIAYLNNQPFTGVAYTFFPNGSQQTKQTYLNGKKEGEWSIWYESGTPQIEGFLKDGKLHGIYREYYANGNLRYEYEYDLDRKTGIWKGWYEDGTQYTIKEFQNDTLDGKVLVFGKNGELNEEYEYIKGIPVLEKSHLEETH